MTTLPPLMSIYQDIKDHTEAFPDHDPGCLCMGEVIMDLCDKLGIYEMIAERNAGEAMDFNDYIQSKEGKSLRRIVYVLKTVVSKL